MPEFKPWCPKCGSTNVESYRDGGHSRWDTSVANQVFHCRQCGFVLYSEKAVAETNRQQEVFAQNQAEKEVARASADRTQAIKEFTRQALLTKVNVLRTEAQTLVRQAEDHLQMIEGLCALDEEFIRIRAIIRVDVANIHLRHSRLKTLAIVSEMEAEVREVRKRVEKMPNLLKRAQSLGTIYETEQNLLFIERLLDQRRRRAEEEARTLEIQKAEEARKIEEEVQKSEEEIAIKKAPRPARVRKPRLVEDTPTTSTPTPTVKKSVPVVCAYCGVTTYKYPYEVRRCKTQQFFCKDEHRKAWFTDQWGFKKAS